MRLRRIQKVLLPMLLLSVSASFGQSVSNVTHGVAFSGILSLHEAATNAVSGDSLRVLTGTYESSATFTDVTNLVIESDEYVQTGSNANTLISGSLYFNNFTNITVKGVTLLGDYAVSVSAGDDVTLVQPTLVANVSGVIDDPSGGTPTSVWSQVSGPGAVVFGAPGSTNTSVTLPAMIGSYVLRFFAGNGVTSDSDDVIINLESSAHNVIDNPGFETGDTTGWTQHAGLTTTATSSESYEGIYACRNSGRDQSYDGLAYELKNVLTNGNTYVISAWVKLENAASDSVKLTVKQIEDGGAPKYMNVASVSATNDGWRRLSGEFSVATTGTVDTLLLYVSGPAAGVNYWVDDFSCYEGALATLDLDQDALSDDWEWHHFGGTGSSSGQSVDDADGDGFIDLHEYYALTDPNDSNDVFAIDSLDLVTTNSAQHVVEWHGAATRLYSILSTTNLSVSWVTNAFQQPGQDAPMSYTNDATLEPAFYKVQVELGN